MNWNNIGEKEFLSVSIIVGSRCGGFDFYAKQINENEMFWLGGSEKSDLDIYINNENLKLIDRKSIVLDKRNLHEFKNNIRHGVEFPFLKFGKLFIPTDKTYLSLAIRKKMKLNLKKRWEIKDTLFEICDQNKNYVSTILFKPMP